MDDQKLIDSDPRTLDLESLAYWKIFDGETVLVSRQLVER